MASVFWDHKEIIWIECFPQSDTNNNVRYYEILKKIEEGYSEQEENTVAEGSLYSARQRQTQPGKRKKKNVVVVRMENFEEPSLSSDLVPSHYHLFTS